MFKDKKGISLVELLAVIAIISILFILLLSQVSSAVEKSRDSGVRVDLRDYLHGMKSYFMEEEGHKDLKGLNNHLSRELAFKEEHNQFLSKKIHIKTRTY